MKNIKIYSVKIMLSLLFLIAMTALASASSHREAPLISNDPLADNCDVYAFRSPNDTNKITLIATYVPMQNAHGGPNYYSFGENVRYELHIDNNTATTGDDITYRFTFHKMNQDPSTFFNIRLGAENLKTTYTMEKSMNNGMTWTTIIANGIVPPPNIGGRSIEGGAGLNSSFSTLFNNAITTSTTGEKVFCGSVDDPFFVDLGGVFDLGDMPRQGGGTPKDGLKYLNVSAIAIEVDIAALQKNGQGISAATSILDPNFVIGVWASASRQKIKTLSANGSQSFSGPWVQVSRLGMPLTNEAVIPIGKKDLWNSITPYQDLAYLDTFKNFFYNPELALYMDDSLYGGAVPAFGQLRIQHNSLQAFDFGNGKNGLYALKGSAAVAGTALDDAIFGTLLLPAPNSPRSVDLWPIFHTGVPNLAPYHLATGKAGNPLANGKPFINNFLPNGGDMLRLNMAVPITPRNSPAFSSEGIVNAAVLGLTDPMYNTTTTLQFIPNMDGFPNGRRLEDDVTRIELQAVAGVALAAIGLWYDDYTAGGANPVTTDLVDVLSYSTGINNNDIAFSTTFPFMQQPWRGTGDGGGLATPFTQAPCLMSSFPLGVSSIDFDANNVNEKVLLTWHTENKQGVKGFEIQRQYNAGLFEKIGFVESNSSDDYKYNDLLLQNGQYLYRLKIIDFDGKFSYSEVKKIILNEKLETSIYPNPVLDELNIVSSVVDYSYTVRSIDGKQIEAGVSKGSNVKISTKALTPGIYYISINSKTGTETLKFLKK